MQVRGKLDTLRAMILCSFPNQSFLHSSRKQDIAMLARVRFRIRRVFIPFPLDRCDLTTLAIYQSCISLRPQEIPDGVAMLILVRSDNTMDTRFQALPRQKSQRITDVDDHITGSGLNEGPRFIPRYQHLQAPLAREQDGQGTDIGVLVLSGVDALQAFGIG